MYEMLIKELIKCKLNAAELIMNNLPPEMSEEIKKLGKIILESINESCRETEGGSALKTKRSDKLENVPVE